jgi:hypothetical protein
MQAGSRRRTLRALAGPPATANVGQHDPGADHITDGTTSLLDCAHHDLEAAPGLAVNVADAGGLAVTDKRRGTRNRDPKRRTDGVIEYLYNDRTLRKTWNIG